MFCSQIKQFHSYCGGLPAPETANNPLGYKFSWSSRGVLLALLNAASWLEDGQVRSVEGNKLMALAKPYYISPAFAFVAYPNRSSAPYREWYGIPEADTVVRGTLRYQGFPEFIRALVQLGWLDAEPKEWVKEGLTWAEATKRATGAKESSER
jgi:spermidine synthase